VIPVHVESTAVGRLRGLELTASQFFGVALATLGALWLIVATGAAVRLTESGLGCRHWPGCEAGHPLPAKSVHAYIEFGNRLVGGVTILLTLGALVAAWRTPALPRWAKRLAAAIFVGTLAQAPLGYLAVKTDLRWPVVMAHLLLSMLLLAGAVVLALEAYGLVRGHGAPAVPAELRHAGLALAPLCLALLVSGAFATAAGPHSGGGAEHVSRFGKLDSSVYVHAGFVAAFGCTFLLALGYLAARRDLAPRLFRFGLLVLALLLAQVALGEIQYRTHLPWGLVLVHVAVAATVWAGVVALVVLLRRPPIPFARA
jgi:cytochrome c oxidase assembly protein subunit 15